jgi:hypothetical protein
MKKKKAIKIATASVLTASSFAAVAPFTTEAAVNISSYVSQAANQMKKAQDTYAVPAVKGQAVSAAAVKKEVDLASKYYASAKSVISKYAGKQSSYYYSKLAAAMPYYNNAVGYIKAKTIAENLNAQADQLNKAIQSGNVDTVKKLLPSLNDGLKNAEANIRKFAVGAATQRVIIATLSNPKAVAQQAADFLKTKTAPVVTSVSAINDITVDQGTQPTLPKTVTVTYSDGSTKDVAVTWDTTSLDVTKAGTYTLTGKVEGTDKTASVKVVVNAVAPTVASVSPINKDKELTVTFDKDVTEAQLTGKTLTLTSDKGDKVTFALKAGSVAGKTAVFAVSGNLAEGTYTVSSDSFKIADGTTAVYDVTAPTVASGEVADYQNLKVNFSEPVKGTPVLKVNGTDVDPSTVTLAKDGKSLTITKTAGYAAGTYNVAVSGLQDAVGNQLADTTVSIVKEDSTFGKVTFTSKAINVSADPTTGAQNGTTATLNFKVVDQYGQDINTITGSPLKLKAFYNGYPLNTASNAANAFSFVLNDNALINGRNIDLHVYKTVDNADVEIGTATLPVVAAQPKLTSVDSISMSTSADATDLKAGDTVTLSAVLKDQFNNDGQLFGSLRWVTSDNSIASFTSAPTANFVNGAAGSKSIDLTLGKQGTATITAYLPDGSASKSYTITVGQGKLASITTTNVGTVNVTNKAAASTNVVVNAATDTVGKFLEFKNANSANIPVKASDVNFTVTAPTGFAASDVTVEKVVDDQGYLTGLKVSSNRTTLSDAEKAGDYSSGVAYTVTVKSTDDKVSTQTFTVNSKIDSKVASIDSISNVSFRANGQSDQAVFFRNAEGEVLNLTQDQIKLTPDSGLTVTPLTTNAKGEFVAIASDDNTSVVKGLRFGSDTKATYKALVNVGAVSTTVNVAVNDAAKISSINLGNDITSGVVSGDSGLVYQPITVKDQDGNKMNVAPTDLTLASAKIGTTSVNGFSVGYYKTDSKGNYVAATDASDAQGVALVIDPSQLSGYTSDQRVAVTVTNGLTGTAQVANTVNVTVKAQRVLSALSVTPTSGPAVVGSGKTFTVSGVDQYGQAYALNASNVKAVLPDPSLSVASTDQSDKAVKVTLSGTKAGSYAVKFYVDNNTANNQLDPSEKSVTATFNVQEIGDAINSLVINKNVDDAVGGTTTDYTVDSSNYKVKVNNESTVNKITLNATAYDAAGNEVAVKPGDVIWTVVSNNLVEGTSGAVGASFDGNVLTLDTTTTTGSTADISGSIKVRATSLNGKTADVTLYVSSKDNVAQAGTYKFATTANGLNADQTSSVVTVANLDSTVAGGALNLYLVATDQYGQTVDVAENSAVLGLDNSTIVAKDNSTVQDLTAPTPVEGVIKLTAKAAGSTTLRAFINGEQVTIPVTVSQAAVDAAK